MASLSLLARVLEQPALVHRRAHERVELVRAEVRVDRQRGEVSAVEVAQVEGEQVVQQTQELPVSDIIALGGNAPNETAWLVVFKRKL